VAYWPAQEGIALTSPENIQLTTGNSLTLTSENQTDINALKNVTVSSGEAIGLFAHKSGMKVFANQGDIEVQAQNANLNMAAKQDIKIDSVDGELAITASKKITLICGDSYIKISSEGIELGTQDNVYLKCNVMQKMGPKDMDITQIELPYVIGDYAVKFICKDETGKIYANEPYIATLPNGRKVQGQTDKNGYTQAFYSENENETITLEFIRR
jgi:type VI secretion system secreted protein VgrG